MANQTPGVVFKNNQLGFKLSSTVLENLTSEMLTAPKNKIVNGNYQGDVAGNFSVYVLRNNLYDPEEKILGETKTEWIDDDDFLVENEVNSIDLKYLYEKQIVIPTLLTMSLPTPTIDEYAKQVSQGLARSLDRSTLGEMIGACMQFSIANADKNVITVDDASATYGEDLASALGQAQVKLDEGMEGKDITCPQADRFAILASEAYQAIIDSGVNLNSNTGAEIQAFNKFYQNSFKDFNIFKAVPQILGKTKARYRTKADAPASTVVNKGVKAICGHNVATTRAVDYSVGTRIVLSSEASKTNIIPLYRWGVKCLRPWFIVVVCTAAFLNTVKTAIG